MEELWQISDCLNLDFSPKRGRLHNNLIGQMCIKPLAIPGGRMIIELASQEAPNRPIYSSAVIVTTENADRTSMVVKTENSIYFFKQLQK